MRNKREAGFTYIDVMIAVVILLVGILALVSAISGAILQTKGQEEQLDAKQIATSAMESIMSVKETSDRTRRLGWNAVGNTNSNPDANGVNQGKFVIGFQQVKTGAGPDNIIGTDDDNGADVSGFRREIVIADICDPDRPSYNCSPAPTNPQPVKMRSVQITVTYFVGSAQRQEVMTTILTDYANVDE